MKVLPTELEEILIIQPSIFRDHRGIFIEVFKSVDFEKENILNQFIQENQSGSKKGVLRGLHYQITRPQGKLVRVTYGQIFDVAVDIRQSSKTFGKWVGKILSRENRLQMWVPPGFAHGFYTLSDWAEISYKLTDLYDPKGERCIAWNDPELKIDWHLHSGETILLSQKDKDGKLLADADLFE